MEFWTAHLLTYWIYVGFLLLLLSMDSLPSCVSPDLPKNIQIVLNCEVIKKQDCVKYLGVLIDSSLSWEKHISRTRKKCYSGLSQLRRLGSIPPNLKKQLYNSLVLPHLDYCSVVWQEASMILLKSIEQVQNYGMRIFEAAAAVVYLGSKEETVQTKLDPSLCLRICP